MGQREVIVRPDRRESFGNLELKAGETTGVPKLPPPTLTIGFSAQAAGQIDNAPAGVAERHESGGRAEKLVVRVR